MGHYHSRMRDHIADGSIHRNLEYKAQLLDLAAAVRTAEELGAVDRGESRQVDTYFHVPGGRLKLRESAGREAQLIAYTRDEQHAERWSSYRVAPISEAAAVHQVLAASLGTRGTVEKLRRVFLWNDCRIHLDVVVGLGQFIEFEVLSQGNPNDDYRRMAALMRAFGLSEEQAILASYADLLGP
jgi:predicted adenylyl cyclase CyaB